MSDDSNFSMQFPDGTVAEVDPAGPFAQDSGFVVQLPGGGQGSIRPADDGAVQLDEELARSLGVPMPQDSA